MIRQSFFHSPGALLAATIIAAAAAGPALAQQLSSRGDFLEDPIIAWNEANAGRNHFFLNGDTDVEIIRFRTPRDINICAGPARLDHNGVSHGYALKVSWDAQSAVVQPGSCLAFDAQKVSVRSATHLPQDFALEGTFRATK